ncbi:hypothetical protein D9619_009058 [Psilocybe cf. subviscida]|uniref:Chitinase n=1 Tax=Psilocybe cf. subviscida TaxID=2480587 RepID=A0A8H5BUH9_9AGAR|nr:hypothetical protein D9619_009058 [Psilocybe cf. subviscida]
MVAFVAITEHTTTSKPNTHVVYVAEVTLSRSVFIIERRYSEFLALHEALGDEFPFPPKRFLSTSILPSAWIDDTLIAERKAGLAKWLSALLWSSEYQNTSTFLDFLNRPPCTEVLRAQVGPDVGDVLPSSLSRASAIETVRSYISQRELESAPPAEPQAVGFVSSAYYPHWAATSTPPESLDYSKIGFLFFGFVTPNETASLDWVADTASVLRRIVLAAKASNSGIRTVLSIGGWEGSQWFSYAVSTAVNRVTFVEALVNAMNEYDLAGFNIDWEFPNSKGFGNPYSPEDSANLLLFFTALRSALGPSKIISAAVSHSTWLGPDGLPLSDVSAFAKQLSYINIMNYSAVPTSNPGSNAPLSAPILPCSAEAAMRFWSAAGFPKEQMLLGIPLFGFVFKTKKTSLVGDDSVDALSTVAFKGAHKEIIARPPMQSLSSHVSLACWWGKQIPFKNIVQSGALVKRFDGNYGQGAGYTLAWDDTSSTPYLFNSKKRTLITFDNTRSLAAKVRFAKENGLAGCCAWSLDMDDGTSLQDVIRTAMGV